MLELGSFNICMNTILSMIAILGHSEVNTEALDVSMETTESNNCRKILGDDRNTNSILAVT